MPTSDDLRQKLEAELKDVEAKRSRITKHLRNQDRTVPQDWAEMATFLENDEVLEMLEVRTADRVGELKRALTQVEAGTYGACVQCGRTIEAERLELLSSATTCASCARRGEPTGGPRVSGGSLEARVAGGLAAVADRVTAALNAEGFGVLTRIDLDQVFRNKLGLDWPAHAILGACNPTLAHKALSSDKKNALLLPCNVAIEAEGDECIVRILDPLEMLGTGSEDGDQDLAGIAGEARERLERVAEALRT